MEASRETSLSREITQNSQSKQKSTCLDKPISPSTPRITNKSERHEKQSTPSPLRRSDRNKKNMSSSSNSKQSVKEFTSSNLNREKYKAESLIQVLVDIEKTESALESVGVKRKNMDARSFKSLFKRQQIKTVFPEILGNEASIDSSHIDYVMDEIPELCHGDGLKDNRSNSSVRKTYNDSERLPTYYLTATNTNAPVPQSSAFLESSQYCAISTENGETCLEMKEIIPSSSAKCETPSILGICMLCNKNKRASYCSPEEELCCSATLDDGLSNVSASKDGGDHGAAIPLESYEHCCSRNAYRETNICQESCAICGEDGIELLCCWGNGCNRCYHLSCLDPPLTCALPGVWHCPRCVYKKFALGVHSVSKRVESIWDVREVKATNAKGMHRQKQYFVKYHGLAHVHNHWVSDNQLCPEKLSFFFNFIAKDQIVRWSSEWTVPHRLLRKRPVHKFEVLTSTDVAECHYEWLVKWHGLNYDHSSWELDSACFLSSSLGQKLMRDYEIRLENAKKLNKHQKGSFIALSELTLGESPVNNSNLLKNVNELRYCLFNCQNAAVFNNQDGVITLILFIQSMIAMCQPFLIIASSESFSLWEAEFARVAPSVAVVIYGGNRETRKGIRASEFFEEGGYVMLQVLLSSMQAVLEDLDLLRCIRWKAIIIDDYQHSVVPNTLRLIKTLASDLMIFLINDGKEPQDMTSEYLNLLHWLDSHDDFGKIRCLNFSKDNDSLERLLCCTSIESTSEVSKFVEYWVPVQISNYQLELYCDALLNSNTLCSSSRSDLVGALRGILLTVRKCCDHPYLVDTSTQKALFAEQHPAAEILEIGIKASGKLHVLDLMLSEINTQGLQVMILYQMLVGPEGATIGDILDDFCRQRFGENTYERVDARVINSRKQAAVDRFNKRETRQFVFLLENRACSSSIKLSSLDLVIIYDSDWNPANDLRALQKISIDSKVEQIKVFRLYSSCTVEERALVLAKQNINLDTSLQRLTGRVTYDTLLMWGASYLFSLLDEYHAASSSIDLRSLSGQLLLNEVIMEFHAMVSNNCEIFYINPLISKVTLHDGYYKSNSRNFGEAKVHLMDGVEPYIFWRNLLYRKNIQWKYLKGQCPRNRKRVQCLMEPSRTLGCENGDASKKHKRVVNDNVDPSSVQGNHTTVASNQFQPLPIDSSTNNNPNCVFGQRSFPTGAHTFESEERFLLLHKRKSRHSSLQVEVTRICQLLKISDDVVETAKRFLEYVIKNHDARSDSPAITQAFQISLVSENEIHRHLLSMKLQDREPAVEIPSTLHIEVATLELIDTATVFQSNREESTGNHELLHAMAVDTSFSCDQSHLSEMEHPIKNQERSPSQSAAARETAELFDVFISQSCEPSHLQDSHLDLGPSSRFNSDQSMEIFASSPNNTAIAEAVQVASWNSTPSSLAEPLEDEVERLRKEVEQLEKTYENVMSQFRSDCEKEIEEIIAQIRSKYEGKINDAAAEFRLMRNEVEKNRNIILMNKKLAEAFRSKCVNLKASRGPRMQQAFSSGFMPLPSTRLPSAASASRPPHQQTTAPFQQMLPHQPIPNYISSPVASQNVTTPPHVQVVPRTGPQISGCSSRSPVISGITSAANLHTGMEIYSPTPHLQSFTPAVPPLVGCQIRSPALHLHPFSSAAPPHVDGETRSQGSHFQPFRPAGPTSTALHQHLPKQKYRRLDQIP